MLVLELVLSAGQHRQDPLPRLAVKLWSIRLLLMSWKQSLNLSDSL